MDDDLTFADSLGALGGLGESEWITAYENRRDSPHSPAFYSALIAEDQILKSLKDPSWDLSIGNGLPGISFDSNDGKKAWTYFRWSNDGVVPLVIKRSFYGIEPGYWEVAEEFRFYFNLYEDRRNSKFISINDNGDEEDVILVSDSTIMIKLRLIEEFLAVKKMRLALFFDLNRFSRKTLGELGISEYHEHRQGNDFAYSIGVRPWSHDVHKAHGFLMGKKLVSGPSNWKPRSIVEARKTVCRLCHRH